MEHNTYNYLVQLSFVGTAYHGSQIQNNAVTVQSEFQAALQKVLGYLPAIKCCSRTDSGVHAKQFFISFNAEQPLGGEKLVMALNANLPRDIRVHEVRDVPADFHARYSALGKRYEYHIVNSRVMDPFMLERAYQFSPHLDEKMLGEIAAVFLGKHDFSAFCSGRSAVEDKVRAVTEAKVVRTGDRVVFSFAADGFLYNMVRIMTGALLQCARGKLTAEDLKAYLNGRPRDNLLITAPACGLYLTEVFYDFEH
ncbi:MAG: tRNA pseudouridine(38-40) synthase TruA [Oscillospiraceae bacterium]|nr:tRNA pseudouridine(38-40) synthase TruA [Oscillospiraceae bacterium]